MIYYVAYTYTRSKLIEWNVCEDIQLLSIYNYNAIQYHRWSRQNSNLTVSQNQCNLVGKKY